MINYCQNSEILSATLSLSTSIDIYLSTHLLLRKNKTSAKQLVQKGRVKILYRTTTYGILVKYGFRYDTFWKYRVRKTIPHRTIANPMMMMRIVLSPVLCLPSVNVLCTLLHMVPALNFSGTP